MTRMTIALHEDQPYFFRYLSQLFECKMFNTTP